MPLPPSALDLAQRIALIAPVLLLAMVAHEYAHGWAARRQGDPTAWQLGRLTWNPLKHIDPFLTVILPLMLAIIGGPIFGGAKPVPVNPRNYRNYRRGDIIVSLAGITANLAIAALSIPAIVLVGMLGEQLPALVRPLGVLQQMLEVGILVNCFLAAFNLMPIPPLDGSHVVKHLLLPRWALAYQEAGRYGLVLLVLLLSFGRGLVSWWLTPAYLAPRLAGRLYQQYLLPNPFLG